MNTSTFFEHLVHEDRVHRSIYTDPFIFEREMTHVFGAVWVYLAHESQVPDNDDYFQWLREGAKWCAKHLADSRKLAKEEN